MSGESGLGLRSRVAAGLRAVLGDLRWNPPHWPRWLGSRIRQRPGRWIGIPVLLIIIGVLGYKWLTYVPPPPPDALDVSVQAPGQTLYTTNPIAVKPLAVVFSGSAAPLDAIGDSPTRAVAGLTLTPQIAGKWVWLNDHQLQFSPGGDWPVGQHYQLTIDPQQALAKDVSLLTNRLEFDTAPFALAITSAEFYQDPQDPKLKRGNWALSFSHPVDPQLLQSHLKIAAQDAKARALPVPEFNLRVDDSGLKAWVQTAPLNVPDNGGVLTLELAAGVKSRVAGPGEAKAAQAQVAMPSLYSVALSDARIVLADNDQHEPEQVLVLHFNDTLHDVDVRDAVHAWILPDERLPKPGERQQTWPRPYRWSASDVGEDVLARATPVKLDPRPGEREWLDTHNFHFDAKPGQQLYIKIDKGLKSFGGFMSGDIATRVLSVPPYPKLLKFVGEGSLLSLRGERRVSIVARNQPHARLEVARVLPEQLAQFVSANDGSFSEPDLWNVNTDALVERFDTVLNLPSDDPAKPHYQGVDLGTYFSAEHRGVFLLSLRSLNDGDLSLSQQERLARNVGSETDSRLVVLTDLGVVVKRAVDGTRDVFVQSIAAGTPVAGAQVSVIGRNGQVEIKATTDATGHASLGKFDALVRERAPVLLTVTLGDDMSFLPLGDYARHLDVSRFDIGGDVNDTDPGKLSADLFSDRGLYRPGETVHLGMILRAADWSRSMQGLPLELTVTDPTGRVVRRDRVAFGAEGFEEAEFTPGETAPTGPWRAVLNLIVDANRRTWVGETTVQVRDFQPDTLRVKAGLSSTSQHGWVKPDALAATVHVENLFGTAAQGRRVSGLMNLRPVLPSFDGWPGYHFFDPDRADGGMQNTLADATTDDKGDASLPLGLEQIQHASYKLDLTLTAYEPGSGRGVAATTSALVSDRDYLVGIKAADALDYIQRGSERSLDWVAIGPDGKPLAVEGLVAVQVAMRYVSVLTQGNDGLYRYVSRLRRDEIKRIPLASKAAVQKLALDTSTPGDFVMEIRDAQGTVLNSQDWSVAGNANLSRSLDRNAELSIKLSRASYAPGDEIELSLRAPFAGSGLITIERDHVYSWQWFHADTTASVQHIRVPAGLEGNAYVSVQYLRDPDSNEIFMSPLSYGVVPFNIDRSARTLPVSLDVPVLNRPGKPLKFTVQTGAPARVAVFAVDEGILQVAGYRVGDPLDMFLRKRMDQVDTMQILDLVLPEFSRLMAAAAPGGDGDSAGARHLNPFKRKGEKPAVWWSGLIDVDGQRELEFTPPDSFNGEMRFVAVAVSPQKVGIAEAHAKVRGDFVISPTLPTQLAPGDQFELPVGIANTIEGATSAAKVKLSVELSPLLKRSGNDDLSLTLAPESEGLLKLRLTAGDTPGVGTVKLIASDGVHRAERTVDVSIRPLQPLRSTLRIGQVSKPTAIDDPRGMFDEHASRMLSASASPLVAVGGLSRWLDDYPYGCTEQIVSAALPDLVIGRHPELAPGVTPDLDPVLTILRSRQNSDGGFGYWAATPDVDPFITTYASMLLVEARADGRTVPDDLLDAANRELEQLAADDSSTDLYTLRARALAVYLLVRQGRVESNLLGSVQEQLQRDAPDRWRDDVAGLFVAASYALMKQDRPANELAERALKLANKPPKSSDWNDFLSPLSAQAWRVLLLHRHFPGLASQLAPEAMKALIEPLQAGRFNTMDAALSVLALDAAADNGAAAPTLAAELANGTRQAFGSVNAGLVSGSFDASARRLWVNPAGDTPAWYALSENGFDRKAGAPIQNQGLEVQRDYLDADGKPTTTVEQGQELTVRLRVRGKSWSNVAIVDLLPGGFEAVLAPPTPAEGGDGAADDSGDQDSDSDGSQDCDSDQDCGAADDGSDDDSGDDGDGGSQAPLEPQLALPGSTLSVDHTELREDRVVLFTSTSDEVQEFRYRIRAGSVGSFGIPPVYAEQMYRPEVQARGGDAGRITVTAPSGK